MARWLTLLIFSAWLVGCQPASHTAYPPAADTPWVTPILCDQTPFSFQDFATRAAEANLPWREADHLLDDHFSVQGRVIMIGGEAIVIHEFRDAATACQEALSVSADGYAISRREGDVTRMTQIDWVNTPHFYCKGQLIVVYVGDDESILTALNDLLGPPFAGGKQLPYPN